MSDKQSNLPVDPVLTDDITKDIANDESVVGDKDLDRAKEEEKAFAGDDPASEILDLAGKSAEKEVNLDAQNERLRIENDFLRYQHAEEKILAGERRHYTKSLFLLTAGWLVIVINFVLLTGLQFSHLNYQQCTDNCVFFKLSDNVLIAFITSTTASVIGIFLIVAKWLFPAPEKAKDK